jgi:hypothetical protein
VNISETSINFSEIIRRNMPEGYRLHTCRENLNSHQPWNGFLGLMCDSDIVVNKGCKTKVAGTPVSSE